MIAKERMFRDIVEPSVSVGSRQGRSVLATVVIEALIISAILIAPIVAAPMLPAPASVISYVVAVPTPPPPPPPPPPKATPPSRTLPQYADAAPTTEPDTIQPERPIDLDFDKGDASNGPGLIDGIPNGVPDVPPPPPPPLPLSPPVPHAPVHVGGDIRPPIKTRHVSPVYPPIARSARVQGMVILEAIIGVNGQVMEARVLRSEQALLEQAAIDAVRQWEFTPTLLNNQPVPVIMTVTIQFTLQ